MENKIQELTDKIYREGVEKGNEEARKLVLDQVFGAKHRYSPPASSIASMVKTASWISLPSKTPQPDRTTAKRGAELIIIFSLCINFVCNNI